MDRKWFRSLLGFLLLASLAVVGAARAPETSAHPPKILVVVAHPDDDSCFYGLIYRTSKEIGGTVDEVVITNGEGGYKYSTLGGVFYHLDLTNEEVGRRELPAIRKAELLNAGRILGVRNYHFLDQQDLRYTLDPREPLDQLWDVAWIKAFLTRLQTREHYELILCLLPTAETHGHHKAATLIALDWAKGLSPADRPCILAGSLSGRSDNPTRFTQLDGFPETQVSRDPQWHFDRNQRFGFKNALSYQMICNWAIAEHKSQGTFSMFFSRFDTEDLWWFKANDPAGMARVDGFFKALVRTPALP